MRLAMPWTRRGVFFRSALAYSVVVRHVDAADSQIVLSIGPLEALGNWIFPPRKSKIGVIADATFSEKEQHADTRYHQHSNKNEVAAQKGTTEKPKSRQVEATTARNSARVKAHAIIGTTKTEESHLDEAKKDADVAKTSEAKATKKNQIAADSSLPEVSRKKKDATTSSSKGDVGANAATASSSKKSDAGAPEPTTSSSSKEKGGLVVVVKSVKSSTNLPSRKTQKAKKQKEIVQKEVVKAVAARNQARGEKNENQASMNDGKEAAKMNQAPAIMRGNPLFVSPSPNVQQEILAETQSNSEDIEACLNQLALAAPEALPGGLYVTCEKLLKSRAEATMSKAKRADRTKSDDLIATGKTPAAGASKSLLANANSPNSNDGKTKSKPRASSTSSRASTTSSNKEVRTSDGQRAASTSVDREVIVQPTSSPASARPASSSVSTDSDPTAATSSFSLTCQNLVSHVRSRTIDSAEGSSTPLDSIVGFSAEEASALQKCSESTSTSFGAKGFAAAALCEDMARSFVTMGAPKVASFCDVYETSLRHRMIASRSVDAISGSKGDADSNAEEKSSPKKIDQERSDDLLVDSIVDAI
ncbi:unnamed protein product [Amoebophrya sp. A25]|nr:unnamed protein product [Amoebophrya sp. A25]|eukprot:GSA25T00012065001.1